MKRIRRRSTPLKRYQFDTSFPPATVFSGNSFQHFRMTVTKADDMAAVGKQIKEHEYGTSIGILDIDSVRTVLLPKAPTETWLRKGD